MAAGSLCASANSSGNHNFNSVWCNNDRQFYTSKESDVQNPPIRIKTSIEAKNFSSEEGPRGEEVIIRAYGRTPCDKHDKVYECCNDLVSEKLELSSCKEIIRILHEEIQEVSSLYKLHVNKVNKDSSDNEINNPTVNVNWTYHSTHRGKFPRLSRRNPRQLPLQTSNQFAPPTNLNVDNVCPNMSVINKFTVPAVVQDQAISHKNNSARSRNNKVLIVGDSHARLCATKIKSEINSSFSVQGIVKPGAGAGAIVNTPNSEIENLTKNDVIILMGGANDIAKNDSKTAMRHIRNFINTNSHKNIVVVSVPHRCDLMQSSCVKSEIKSFNRKLLKHNKAHQHVSLLKVRSER